MELKKRKNAYGFDVVECPFCKVTQYVNARKNTEAKGLHQHIAVMAKREAFAQALGDIQEVPHLNYFKEHTSLKVIIAPNKREFDQDIIIK